MSEGTEKQSMRRTRLVAIAVLASFLSAIGYAARQTYEVATDSFIAPCILSPDSDLVLASKLAYGQIITERTRVAGELDEISAAIEADEQGIARLKTLKHSLEGALEWHSQANNEARSGGEAEIAALGKQHDVLKGMLERQRSLTDEARRNYTAGLVSGVDYAREEQSLNQMEVAVIENRRTTDQSAILLRQAQLARRAMSARGGAPATPEMIVREEQLIHIELELIKLDAELRAKHSEQIVGKDKLVKMDELITQMRARPVFRATERSIDVAFVPYTQIDGVAVGAEVRNCVWGLFACETVGKVQEVVPGEVILPDPWGNQARGQYAILELTDREAAKSKTLRVHGKGTSAPAVVKGTTAVASVQ